MAWVKSPNSFVSNKNQASSSHLTLLRVLLTGGPVPGPASLASRGITHQSSAFAHGAELQPAWMRSGAPGQGRARQAPGPANGARDTSFNHMDGNGLQTLTLERGLGDKVPT